MTTHRSVRSLAALAVALTTVVLFACLRSKSTVCPLGVVCPDGLSCAPGQNICISVNCGNGALDEGEACDDGNIKDEDNCRKDTCQPNVCGDGNLDQVAPRIEECEPGSPDGGTVQDTPSCNSNCTVARCGDGYVNAQHRGGTDMGEQCDPGSAPDGGTAVCNGNCTIARCGDRYLNTAADEECDDGQETADCNSNCTKFKCGDRIVNTAAGEDCEPVARDSEDNPLDGRSCDHDCTFRECGDGYTSLATMNGSRVELCDDGNTATDNCGTCSPDCQTLSEPTRASGSIAVTSVFQINDGDIFTINDGIKPPTVFEFDSNAFPGNVSTPRIRIDISRDPNTNSPPSEAIVAMRIESLINAQNMASNLFVKARLPSGTTQMLLQHDMDGIVGNKMITDNIMGVGLTGMSGGTGYDCDDNIGCGRKEDCISRYCKLSSAPSERGQSGKCQPPPPPP